MSPCALLRAPHRGDRVVLRDNDRPGFSVATPAVDTQPGEFPQQPRFTNVKKDKTEKRSFYKYKFQG